MTPDERRAYNRNYYQTITKVLRHESAGQVSDEERAARKAAGLRKRAINYYNRPGFKYYRSIERGSPTVALAEAGEES